MLKTPITKYVARPLRFAFMPPLLGVGAILSGFFLWMMGVMFGFGPFIGMIVGIGGCIASAMLGFREEQIANILIARFGWLSGTINLYPMKGRTYMP